MVEIFDKSGPAGVPVARPSSEVAEYIALQKIASRSPK
jgi:hypothetical protein